MKTERIDTGDALILLIPINGAETGEEYLTASDRDYIAGIASYNRKAELTAWRSAVRQEGITEDILYTETDAPKLSEDEKWRCISVAHTEGMAAVILSQYRCAIDLEHTDRDFRRAARRFVSPHEQSIPGSANPLFTAAVWCAKETLYKLSGRRGLDLLNDIRVNSIDWSGTISGSVRSEDVKWEEQTMKLFLHGNYIVVWVVR